MRSLGLLSLVAALVVLLAGCAVEGPADAESDQAGTSEATTKVKVGMSEQQVKEVLGEPIASMQERSVSVQTVMIYERITVYLKNGAVTKVETK